MERQRKGSIHEMINDVSVGDGMGSVNGIDHAVS